MRGFSRRVAAGVVVAAVVGGAMGGCTSWFGGGPGESGSGDSSGSGSESSSAGGSGAESPSGATRTVYGYVLIADYGMTEEKYAEQQQRLWDSGDSSCVAPAGFEDVTAGSAVQVLGPAGVVATGELGVGDFQSDVVSANQLVGCAFPLTVEGVPADLEQYGIHVGAEARPAYAFTASELRSGPRLFLN